MKKLLLALLGLSLSAPAFAQSTIPAYISYQGKITDASGNPVGNTTPVNRTVIFRIWNSANETAAANRLYSEKQNVTISGGEFSVLIGAGTPVAGETANAFTTFSAAIFAGATRYLGVTVDDGDLNLTNDPESSPRQQMVSTAFALRAQTAESVASGGITSTALANDAVGSAALAAGAVTGTKLAAAAVGTTALADTSVTAGKLAAGAVGATQLADGAVSGAKLAAGAVDATKLADGSVTLAKQSANSVDSSKIIDGGVATADLANLAVDSTKLADGSVTLAKHAANSVDTSKLVDGSATLAKLAANSVDSTKIVDGSIALADLTTSVRDVLPKARAIYNQAVFPAVDGNNWKLVPIDLGDLGNDVDGCNLRVIAMHKLTTGSAQVFDMSLWLQQADTIFTNVDSAHVAAERLLVVASWNNAGSVSSNTARLPPITISNLGSNFATMTNGAGDWIRFYNYYPGSLRSGDSNRENNASTPQGPLNAITMNITSIVTGTNKLTITVDNAHAIQVGDTVTLAGITGSPSALGDRTVTAQPDRTSFEVELTAAAGLYAGGTVTFRPSFNRYRIWAAVNPDISARIIVSDR
jgi:hypothetical protein